MPALHSQDLKGSQEGGIECVEIVSWDTWRSIIVFLEVELATKDLHAQQSEDKDEQKQEEGQINEGIHGLD
jgi:hypothetical protein